MISFLFFPILLLSSSSFRTNVSRKFSSDPVELMTRMRSRIHRGKGDSDISLNHNPSSLERLSDLERLQKVMARSGIASRRASEQMILDGRVVVNGKVVYELGLKINIKKDLIFVDGKKIVIPDVRDTFWIAFNKPKDVLTTMGDGELERQTILNFIPKAKEMRLLPIGGLERDTTGLLILTNENGWIHPLTHPSYSHYKKYEVLVSPVPTEELLQELRNGIILDGEAEKCKSCNIDVISVDNKSKNALAIVELDDTRRAHIPRMFQSIGINVLSSKLVQYGPISIQGLRRGQWRELTSFEIKRLKSSCKLSSVHDVN